ncbi:MAG: PAS domain-containing protein, partial [Nitrospiraceae bacterium]
MKSPLRILYLEDVPRDVELVHGLLAADGITCEIVRVESKPDFAAELDRGRIDLILSDYTVPSFDGFSALTLAQTKLPQVPFIFVSGTIGEESGVITLKAGATDYVLKNRLSRLVPAVRRALRDAEQRVEREQAVNELRKAAERSLSQQSALTGLIRRDVLQALDLTATLQQITEVGARTLRVDRLSLWRFTAERRTLQCVDLYERGAARHSSGMELQAGSYPRYFDALATREIIIADQAMQDVWTAELAQDYLTPHGIAAMMDVPIYLFGHLDAVLCAEHVGAPRRWMQDEQMFVMALSNLISLVYMHAERERAEEALRKSEERFRLVARATNDAVWDWNLLTNLVWWNEGFQNLFGYLPEEIGPGLEAWYGRLHPDDRERVMRGIHQVIDTGRQVWVAEYRFRCASGSYALVMDRGYVLHDETGRPVRMIGSMMDVTERKRAEDRIREQAALLDIAHDAILVRDLEDRIQYWNRGAERLYGWTAEEAVGKTTAELLYLERPPVLDDARRALLHKGQWSGQIHQLTKENKPVVVESHWSLVLGQGRTAKSILEVNSDITDKKLLENKFLQSQRLENLGTLAGGIAHDLNNILTPIIIAAQLLRTNLTEEQRQQWFSMVEVSAQRGAEMVKQVLS